jgi:hypothetical protein
MEDLDNKVLFILILFSITISIFGTLISLNEIGSIQGGGITGLLVYNETGYGTLLATIPGVNFINVSDNSVNLGSIQPGLSNNSETKSDWFVIQNDGTQAIDVQIYDDSQSTAGDGVFLGTTGCLASNNCVQVNCTGNQSGACVTGWTALPSGAGTAIITNLNQTDSKDQFNVSINVTIPDDEPAQSYSETITFLGVAAS